MPLPTPWNLKQELQIKQEPESGFEEGLAIKQEFHCTSDFESGEDKGALSTQTLVPKLEGTPVAENGKEER